ncbi:MAG TPA: aminotransferase class III-fold pyridoxal phosphate-dependent enzyme [Cellulomonas sp.]
MSAATASTSTGAPPAPGDIAARARRFTIYEWGTQRVDPLEIVRGKGVYLYGSDGREYLDLNSLSMSMNIGHGDERVVRAVADQMTELACASPFMATPARADVGEMLAAVTPAGLTKAFFTNGGTDANEAAVRTARLVTGRRKILTRRRSYHGGSLGSLAASGDPRRWPVESGVTDVVRIPDPYAYRRALPGEDDAAFLARHLAELEEIVELEGPHTIAALLVEPITGSNGIIVPPDGWLAGLRALCDRYGILLVFDEVMSGFGRTGRWFACDHEGVAPDIMTVAKGITSGYVPLGACLLSDDVATAIDDLPFGSGLTYNAHVAALAAARAHLEIYRSDGLIENSATVGAHLLAGLRALAARHPSVGDVRGRGLFTVLELVHDPVTKVELFPLVGPTSPVADQVRAALVDAGVLASMRGPFLFANPPLIITTAQVDGALTALDAALTIADTATSAAGAAPPPHSTLPHPAPWRTR